MIDLLGLLAATAGVVAFPGGLYAMAAATATWLGGAPPHAGSRVRAQLTPVITGGLVTVGLAAALVPLPGTPVSGLPAQGAPPNLLALLLLLAAAAALLGSAACDPPRLIAAAAAVLPILLLSADAATFAPVVVLDLTGSRAGVARLCAGIALLVAAPLVAGAAVGWPRMVLLGVTGILAVAVGEPRGVADAPAVVSAMVGLVAAGAVGMIDRRLPMPLRPALAAAAALAAATSAGLAISLL